MKTCEKCKKEFEPFNGSHSLCRSCYAKETNQKICGECGKMFPKSGLRYCSECGLKLYLEGKL